jgi:hypothetical protein
MRRLFSIVTLSIVIYSCRGKEAIPANVMPREKMQEVLWSMLNAGEFINGYVLTKDSVDKVLEGAKIYGQVFQVHKVTREEFERSFSWYKQHPELMKVILDSLSKKQAYIPGTFQRREDSMKRSLRKDTLAIEPVE